MSFIRLDNAQMQLFEQLEATQELLDRSQLTEMLANIRLQFVAQARDELGCDRQFLNDNEEVRLAVYSAIAASESEALIKRADVHPWLRHAPVRIEKLVNKLIPTKETT